MNKVYLLLGGNIGDREAYLGSTRKLIDQRLGRIIATSSIYETEPWGFDHDTPFLNQLLVVLTGSGPRKVMDTLLETEKELGRIRGDAKYSARVIDIDILFFNKDIINEKGLIIPHPRLQERRFALEPLAEVEPDLLHPVLNKTISELLAECSDTLKVKKI